MFFSAVATRRYNGKVLHSKVRITFGNKGRRRGKGENINLNDLSNDY